ncbi:hypothetical protein IQ255_01545 [Pleurocapsales cyanobacterium LEGE 10410]|nr:hypothetical protein [Pleurocapsales cyanobacterium LEGE 10410]
MTTEDKSKKMADEYGVEAKKAMDRVTDEQNEEVKQRVDKVQEVTEKTNEATKDALS